MDGKTRDESGGQDVMTGTQIAVVAICVLINALDGFDVLAIAFSAPAIAREWSLSAVDLGSLFSAGLVGMALGAFFLSPLGDRIGRRRTVLLCLVILCLGMTASAAATSMLQLWGLRFFTGIGIGAMLATINTLVAEFATPRRRALCIALMSLGYPLGATAGAAAAAYLISAFSWHAVYLFGGAVALLLFVVALSKLPESLDYLMTRQGGGALEEVNALRARLGRHPLAALPPVPAVAARGGFAEIVASENRSATVLICVAYFGTMITMFFAQSWIPKLLVGMGFTDAGGISGAMLMNLAGAFGCIVVGYLGTRHSLRHIGMLVLAGLFVGVVLFGFVPARTLPVVAVLVVMGFCSYGCIAALYGLVPAVFPTACRATGTGVALGVGRIGAIVGPYLAGLLIQNGWDRPGYCFVLAAPLLASVAAIWSLRPKSAGRSISDGAAALAPAGR